ncbi:hypothetical protein LguiB_031364 [Lonicera macranthoides]
MATAAAEEAFKVLAPLLPGAGAPVVVGPAAADSPVGDGGEVGSAKGEEDGLAPEVPASGEAARVAGAAETKPTRATKTRARTTIWRAIFLFKFWFFYFIFQRPTVLSLEELEKHCDLKE